MVNGSYIYWALRNKGWGHDEAFARTAQTMGKVSNAQNKRYWNKVKMRQRLRNKPETARQAINRAYGYRI